MGFKTPWLYNTLICAYEKLLVISSLLDVLSTGVKNYKLNITLFKKRTCYLQCIILYYYVGLQFYILSVGTLSVYMFI